jgi:hypothetical protein
MRNLCFHCQGRVTCWRWRKPVFLKRRCLYTTLHDVRSTETVVTIRTSNITKLCAGLFKVTGLYYVTPGSDPCTSERCSPLLPWTVQVISWNVSEWGSPKLQHARIVTCTKVLRVWTAKKGSENHCPGLCVFCDVFERIQIVKRLEGLMIGIYCNLRSARFSEWLEISSYRLKPFVLTIHLKALKYNEYGNLSKLLAAC